MDDVKDQIITTLSKKNKYLTISGISFQSGLNRHTVATYPGILEVLEKVRKNLTPDLKGSRRRGTKYRIFKKA
jgi:hypothetical protein